MSNRVTIEPTKFEDVRTGEVSYGVRVYDDYGQTYDNTWESLPDDDMDILHKVLQIEGDRYITDLMFDVVSDHKGLLIGGKWYDWEEIEETCESLNI